MLYNIQDSKYRLEVIARQKAGAAPGHTETVARLVNKETSEPIPADEPIFILRGKDKLAEAAVLSYAYACDSHSTAQAKAVIKRAEEFARFALDNPERMRLPD
jgi:hypothetical protein